MRNLNTEFEDSEDRKYAYDFDYRMHDFMLRTFDPYIVNMQTALEMGCYKGEFTKKLIKKFKKLTVLEGSSDLITQAKQNVANDNVFFKLSTFENASFPEKFDAIFLVHTLEHLDQPKEILHQIGGWLKPKGLLFLVVPNAHALSRQIAVKMGLVSYNSAVTEGEHNHGHRKTYSLDTLQHEVQNAGLKVMSSGGICVKPMANFQIDMALGKDIISEQFLEGCFELGQTFPDICSSIYTVCVN